MYDIHLFQAIATAGAAPENTYRPGDRHAMLVFVRQAHGTNHDWALAEASVSKVGWTQISFRRAGTLSAEKLNGKSNEFVGAFEQAMNAGFGLVVYSEPIAELRE